MTMPKIDIAKEALAAAEARLAEAQADVDRLRAALAGEQAATSTANEVRAEIQAAVRRRNGMTRSDQIAAAAAAAGSPVLVAAPGTPTAGSSWDDGVHAARARRRR